MKNKDIPKFLDGLYVSEKTTVVKAVSQSAALIQQSTTAKNKDMASSSEREEMRKALGAVVK